jgi:hypothetical protein
MATHDLKCDHDQFELVMQGLKKFEVRFNDRGFQDKDTLRLHETHYSAEEMRTQGKPLVYTGRIINCLVTHIMRGDAPSSWQVGPFLLGGGVVIMSVHGEFLAYDDNQIAEYKNFCEKL